MLRVLWFRSSGRNEEIDQIQKFLNVDVHVVLGPAPAWQIEEAHVLTLELPLPPAVLKEALITVGQMASPIPVLVYDPESVFEEDWIVPLIQGFHLVSGRHAATEIATVLKGKLELSASLPVKSGTKEPWRELLLGESAAMKSLHAMIRLAGPRRSTVLITGESGTGKEMVARAIHMASSRSGASLVPMNCAAIPENLVESELFGHIRGAFTGAVSDRPGRFEQAQRGTIFLDEIGEVPLEIQPKLLRVLQEREIYRVGSSVPVQVDARMIAASNRDLHQAVDDKLFRQDLLYRLNVVPIVVPPLRDRTSDIPLLAEHFLEKICVREGLGPKTLSEEALRRLCDYDWPGNVRQLEHMIEMAATLSGDRMRLYSGDIQLPAPRIRSTAGPASRPAARGEIKLEEALRRMERLLIEEAMQQHGGNKAKAASSLGVPRTTLHYKLRNSGVPA